MKYWKIVLFVLLISAYTDCSYAQMYKWVDQNGKVTYSNVAPPSSAQKVEESQEISKNRAHTPPRKEITQAEIKNARKNLSTPRIVPCKVSGTVVDSYGTPVSKVKMTVIEERTDPKTWETKQTRRHQVINDTFDVSCEDCAIRLRFQADGFYPKKISFKLNEAEQKAMLYGREGDGFSLVRNGVQVVLEKSKASPVNLHRISSGLQIFSADDTQRKYGTGKGDLGQVIWFNRRSKWLSSTSKRTILKKRKENGNSEPPMIALEAPPAQFNELFNITKKLAQGYRSSSQSQVDVYLDFSGPQTGVIPAHIPESETNYNKIYRSLAEAPESGYTQRIKVKVDPGSSKKQYFYCRIGGLYGKGSVSSLHAKGNNVRELSVAVEIYLNIKGSNNLDSLDY